MLPQRGRSRQLQHAKSLAHANPQIKALPSMLASVPASMLNQNPADSGIPRFGQISSRSSPRLQTSGNRAWRARQGDPAQAANDGEGLADNGPGWPHAEPQP